MESARETLPFCRYKSDTSAKAVLWGGTGMNISTFYRKRNRRGFLSVGFLRLVAIACILIVLIAGEVTAHRTDTRPVSAEEAAYYGQYSIVLPNGEGARLDAASVLALCTLQEEVTMGDRRLKLYTSDVLPQYLYQCSSIREIMETSEGTVYITYTSHDDEQVILTVGGDGIMVKTIYVPETDTCYVLSESGNYKYPNFRHPDSGFPVIKIVAGGIGVVLAVVIVLRIRKRAKKGNASEM